MQAQFGLLDAHQRRRVVVTEDRQEAEVPEGAVRQSHGGHGDAVFLQEHLDGAPFHDHVEIRQPVVVSHPAAPDPRIDETSILCRP